MLSEMGIMLSDMETMFPDLETMLPDLETMFPDMEIMLPDLETMLSGSGRPAAPAGNFRRESSDKLLAPRKTPRGREAGGV